MTEEQLREAAPAWAEGTEAINALPTPQSQIESLQRALADALAEVRRLRAEVERLTERVAVYETKGFELVTRQAAEIKRLESERERTARRCAEIAEGLNDGGVCCGAKAEWIAEMIRREFNLYASAPAAEPDGRASA